MRRAFAIAVVTAGCGSAAAPAPAPVVYPAAAPLTPAPAVIARLGVGAPRVAVASTPIVAAPGGPTAPLAMTGLVGSGDAGPVAAAVSGLDDAGPAIDLIDVDAGVVRWRNRSAAVPAVAIVADLVFAAGSGQVVALDRATGAERARAAATWLAPGPATSTAALAVVAVAGGVALFDGAGLGATAAVPDGAAATDVVALCDAGARFVLAWRGGQLARWDLVGDRATVRWSIAVPAVARVECGAAPLVIVGGGAVRAVALDGQVVGAPRAATDAWIDPRAVDRIELATAEGVETRSRDLAIGHGLVPIAVARGVSAHRRRRVALDRAGAVVVFDGDHAQVLAAPAGAAVVVAGEHAVIAGPWQHGPRSLVERPTRYLWPAPGGAAVLAPDLGPLLPPLTRVDVPAARPLGGAVVGDDHVEAIEALAFDPLDGERLYALVRDDHPTLTRGAGLAAFDLHADRWRWTDRTACPPGEVVALAVAGPVVVCAARGPGDGAGVVQAVTADGGARAWRWAGATVDGVVAGGAVVAILVGAEVIVVDAATGLGLTRWRTSDGDRARLAIATRGVDTRIASLEHGAVVVRSRALAWAPVAATAVDGTVADLFAHGDRFAVALVDGSLYLIADDGAAVAAGAVADGWQPRGDRAVAIGADANGDASVVAVDARGIPRVTAALAGARIATVGARAGVPGAPLAITTAAGQLVVLDDAGAAVAHATIPPDARAWATVIDGRPVAGVVLADPLRVVAVAAAATRP